MDKEEAILHWIKENPYITQNELAQKLGLSRSAIAGYISQLVKKGKIMGRAYVLPEELRITCIGGANVDRKATSFERIQYHTSNPVKMEQSCGGVARNVAENLSRLGCPTSLLSFIGDDQEGQWLLSTTKERGVDITNSYVIQKKRTGTYTAVLDHQGEMVLALADMEIYDDLSLDMITARWPYIASSRMIFADTNMPRELLVHLIHRCSDEAIPLCINPVSAFKAKKLLDNLSGINLLILNRDEAEALTQQKIEDLNLAFSACKKLMQQGVQRIVLTLGQEGICWMDHAESGHIPAEIIRVVDVTGAGDSLVAGVLFGLTEGESLETACRLGMACAHFTLQTHQTVAALSAEQIKKMITTQTKENEHESMA
ncbi:carbohydrate kinase [Ammoniphilus sp. CFH 90114]|uniref:carbohydrate kinase n=1 Tax=Ammoniphilus sp. CFH 90114 TaxID=2493665 RepID=UPI001F0CD9B0|nr:carbohydrate kinase [Ammoniphilus sp. CFH 90114]